MISSHKVAKKNILFSIIAIIMFAFFYKVPIIGDDVYNWQHRYMFNTLSKDATYVVNQYSNWSSRTVVNFFMYIFSTHNIVWFALITALLFYVLLLSLSKIFNTKNDIYMDVCLCLLVLIIPFPYFSTAGWIATTTTYLWPIIAAVYATTFLFSKHTHWYQYILPSIAIIYATNNEQIMIVMLIIYVTTIAINFTKYSFQSNSKYSYLQLILIILNFIYFLASPGNAVRSKLETAKWFPEFAKLSPVNKVDIGFMTTGEHVLFGNTLVVLLLVCLLFWVNVFIQKRGLVFCTPLIILIITSFLFDIFIFTGHLHRLFMFPKLGLLKDFTVFTSIQFILYVVFTILIIFMYFYGQNKYLYIEMIALFIGALLSRIALGFSPTNYVSATRTFAVLSISILIMCIPLIKKILANKQKISLIASLFIFSTLNMTIFFFAIKALNFGKYLPLWLSIW